MEIYGNLSNGKIISFTNVRRSRVTSQNSELLSVHHWRDNLYFSGHNTSFVNVTIQLLEPQSFSDDILIFNRWDWNSLYYITVEVSELILHIVEIQDISDLFFFKYNLIGRTIESNSIDQFGSFEKLISTRI